MFQQHVLSSDTLAMDRQVQLLGGSSSARVAGADSDVWVRVRGGTSEHDSIIGVDDGYVVVRDPREPVEAPTAQGFRRFRVGGTLGGDAGQQQVHNAVGAPALSWLLDGFNASFVAFGQVGTGKTYTLLGGAPGQQPSHQQGLFAGVSAQLFQRIEAGPAGAYVVGISAWDVLNNDTYDLLAYPVAATPSTNPRFINVRVNTFAAALKVVERARAGSQNWAHGDSGSDSEPFVALPNVAHSFVRLTLVDVQKRRCSTLHFVDLAGSQSLDRRLAPRAFQVTSQNAKERRDINQHLLAFSRVVSEMAQAYEGGGPATSHTKLISARDSRLTQLLGPIMSQNSRTIFVATVAARREDFHDTISTLRTATRALQVACPCVVTTLLPSAEAMSAAGTGIADGATEHLADIMMQAAGMVPLQQVLSVRMINEISHLDSSASTFAARVPKETRRALPEDSAPAPTGHNESSDSNLDMQIQTLRTYMARNFPAAHSSDKTDHSSNLESSEESNSAHFQKEFQRVFHKLEQDVSTAETTQLDSDAVESQGITSATSYNEDPRSDEVSAGREAGDEHSQFRGGGHEPEPELHPSTSGEPAAPREVSRDPVAADTMRMNYESLLSVLRDVEHEKSKLDERLSHMEHELAEMKLKHELELDTRNAELIEIQAKLRKSTSQSGFGDLFQVYEQEIGLLQKEAEQLREANICLERQVMSTKQGTPSEASSGENNSLLSTGSVRNGHGRRAEMVSRRMQRELEQLRKENGEMKKKERLFALHQKGFDDANKKVAQLSKELEGRNSQLHSESIILQEYERRLQEATASAREANLREAQIHEGYQNTFAENSALHQRIQKMRASAASQAHTRARSTHSKVASAAGLNVFEHCKRLERDLPNSSRCLANFQRVLKAIDKQDKELVAALDREQELLDTCAEHSTRANKQMKELLLIHERMFKRPPPERIVSELAGICSM